MNHGPFIKITATAAEICTRFRLKDAAKQVLGEGMDPCEFAIALVENKMGVDAIEFMAHALPAREGIWWGCLCMHAARVGRKSFSARPGRRQGAAIEMGSAAKRRKPRCGGSACASGSPSFDRGRIGDGCLPHRWKHRSARRAICEGAGAI